MCNWPADADAGIPSPELVAAWLELDTLPTERIPLWAAHWIAAGHDGEALAELAGLHGDDPHDVRDLLRPALAECGVITPDFAAAAANRQRAAAMVTFNAIAQLHLDGRASAYWVMQKVAEVTESVEFAPSVASLPMGQLFMLEDEWGAGWGRTDTQLRDVVSKACQDQLAQSRTQTTAQPPGPAGPDQAV